MTVSHKAAGNLLFYLGRVLESQQKTNKALTHFLYLPKETNSFTVGTTGVAWVGFEYVWEKGGVLYFRKRK